MTEEKTEKKPMERDDLKVVNDAQVKVSIKMPMKEWVLWDEDCKRKYGDCRWMKMWNEHMQAQNKEELKYELRSYFEKIQAEETETKEEDDGPKTFTSAK